MTDIQQVRYEDLCGCVGVAKIGSETKLSALGLGPGIVRELAAMNLYCLDDLTEVSEFELLVTKHVGARTVGRLRGWLNAQGLSFKQNSNPVAAMHERARSLRKLPLGLRKGLIALDAEVSVLALSTRAFASCLKGRLTKVSDLVALEPRDFHRYLG